MENLYVLQPTVMSLIGSNVANIQNKTIAFYIWRLPEIRPGTGTNSEVHHKGISIFMVANAS